MFKGKIRILNFDNSVTRQKKVLAKYDAEILDLTDIGPAARLWMDSKTKGRIAKRVSSSSKGLPAFLGSGDFHHISQILIGSFNEPVSVISFDFHPDWASLPPHYGCGSWVSRILERKNVLKVVIIGVASSDISGPDLQMARLDMFRDDRVEIYPWRHAPTRIFLKKVPYNVSIDKEKGFLFNRIYWNALEGADLEEFLAALLKRLPTEKVYISIDKDCLKDEYAATNWEEGLISLDELLLMLRVIKQNKKIAGLDITGDYSDIAIDGLFRKIVSYIDHPKKIRARRLDGAAITAINEETNLRILDEIIG